MLNMWQGERSTHEGMLKSVPRAPKRSLGFFKANQCARGISIEGLVALPSASPLC